MPITNAYTYREYLALSAQPWPAIPTDKLPPPPAHETARQQRRRAMLKAKYDLTPEQVEAMAEAQHDQCPICLEPGPYYVDHCHHTGWVRGLLCRTCNIGLGSFYDNPETLRRAAAYLEQFQGTR